jgi:hypothetical protein
VPAVITIVAAGPDVTSTASVPEIVPSVAVSTAEPGATATTETDMPSAPGTRVTTFPAESSVNVT